MNNQPLLALKENFLKLFETYNYLPITTDSHLGEYLPWAHSIADHHAILEFYKNYKVNCQTIYRSESMHSYYFDQKDIQRKIS